MARTKAFNEQEALHKALDIFWQKGFEATSLNDLVDGMGIRRQSLYDTFGDKKSLFIKALKNYRDQSLDMQKKLLSGNDSISDLAGFLTNITVSRKDCHGCFTVNTLVGVGESDPDIEKLVKETTDQIRTQIVKTILSGQETNQIRKDKPAEELADIIFGALISTNVLSKVKGHENSIQTINQQALDHLKQP